MSSVNWSDKSLSQLKQIVSGINGNVIAQLRTSSTHFHQTATQLEGAMSNLNTQMGTLRDAWQGKAATAAVANAQDNAQAMSQTRSTSTGAGSDTTDYAAQLESDQGQAAQIKNVDTSFGHALLTGGWAGPVGVGAKMIQAQNQYNTNHSQMVKVVSKMDSDGQSHASQMKSLDWPAPTSSVGAPPATLPPVPGRSGGGGGGGTGGYPGGSGTSGAQPGPGYTPVVMGPPMSGEDGHTINGTHSHNPGSGGPTTTQGGSSPTVHDPTVTQGGPGTVTTPGTGGTGTTVGSAPTTGGVTGVTGVGAVGGVIGGAGLIGAGATGGGVLDGPGSTRGGSVGEGEGQSPRGSGIGEGEGEPGVRGLRGGALGEGEPTTGGVRGGAMGEGEPSTGGLRGGSLADGESDPLLRSGARSGLNGVPADDELGGPRGNSLAGARPEGFGGEPVAAEAGRTGGYPMGGSGGRRSSDDEEAPMPDYLVETDDVWGDGVSAAPPVIGE